MARNRIRHLEFYGFPDQNSFTGFGDISINLDDIREKNKEQDEELGNLDDEKVDKSDFNTLSGVVDTFVNLQTQMNDALSNQISNNTSAITSIREWIDDVTDEIESIDDLAEKADDILSGMTDLSGTVEDLSSEVASMKDEFAKKDDVYTKEEVDSLIADASGCCDTCVTEDWLVEHEYLTKEVADEEYAKKGDLDALSGVVSSITAISGDVSSLERRVNDLSDTVGTFNRRITDNETEIRGIKQDLLNKANVVDIERLDRKDAEIQSQLGSKVDKSEFNAYKTEVSNSFNDLDEKKLDKSAISSITSDISAVEALINAEKTARENADNELREDIDDVNRKVEDIAEANVNRDSRIDLLESGLAQEIIDRTQGDLNLIGSPSDSATDDTIWGAKKYAVSQKNQAVNEANAYTNAEIGGFRTEVGNEMRDLETALSNKADVAYVDGIKNEVKSDLRNEIDSKVATERERAQRAEADLQVQITNNKNNINENDAAVSHLADRVNAITVWDGTDPNDYDDTGNGVLDVLHREFHTLLQMFGGIGEGTITSNKYEIALGTYNTTNTGPNTEDKTAFSIGVGTDNDHRKNGLELRKNGDLYLWVEGEFMCVNKLLGQLAHETYYDG